MSFPVHCIGLTGLLKMGYYQKYKELRTENHIFTYTGPLSFEDVILLKQLIEKILEIQEAENKQKRRVVNILIEALQNIQIHGYADTYDNTKEKECYLFLGKEADTYFILIGNFIRNENIDSLKLKLDKLVHLSLPEIKQLYLEILDKGEITDKGGASLGLVKIFLDSSKNTSFDFQPVDNEYSFFTLALRVAAK